MQGTGPEHHQVDAGQHEHPVAVLLGEQRVHSVVFVGEALRDGHARHQHVQVEVEEAVLEAHSPRELRNVEDIGQQIHEEQLGHLGRLRHTTRT